MALAVSVAQRTATAALSGDDWLVESASGTWTRKSGGASRFYGTGLTNGSGPGSAVPPSPGTAPYYAGSNAFNTGLGVNPMTWTGGTPTASGSVKGGRYFYGNSVALSGMTTYIAVAGGTTEQIKVFTSRGDSASGSFVCTATWYSGDSGSSSANVTFTGDATFTIDAAPAVNSVLQINLNGVDNGYNVSNSFQTTAQSGGVTGTVALVEGADVLAAAGSVRTTGSGALAEGADTFAAAGAVITSGAVAAVEGADQAAATGSVRTTGALAAVEGTDTLAAAGAVATLGALAVTEGADTFVASGASGVSGSAAVVEAADALAAAGTVRNVGAVTLAEAADTLAAAGVVRVVGTLAVVEGADVLLASGASGVTGAMAVTEGADQVAASGTIRNAGAVALVEGADVLLAAGSAAVLGALAAVEGPDVIAIIAGATQMPTDRVFALPAEVRQWSATTENRYWIAHG